MSKLLCRLNETLSPKKPRDWLYIMIVIVLIVYFGLSAGRTLLIQYNVIDEAKTNPSITAADENTSPADQDADAAVTTTKVAEKRGFEINFCDLSILAVLLIITIIKKILDYIKEQKNENK